MAAGADLQAKDAAGVTALDAMVAGGAVDALTQALGVLGKGCVPVESLKGRECGGRALAVLRGQALWGGVAVRVGRRGPVLYRRACRVTFSTVAERQGRMAGLG